MPVSGLPLHRISTTSVPRAKNHTDDGGGGSDTAALSSVLIIPYSFFLPLFRMDGYSLRVHPFDRAELPATLPVNQSQLHRMIRNQSGSLQHNHKRVEMLVYTPRLDLNGIKKTKISSHISLPTDIQNSKNLIVYTRVVLTKQVIPSPTLVQTNIGLVISIPSINNGINKPLELLFGSIGTKKPQKFKYTVPHRYPKDGKSSFYNRVIPVRHWFGRSNVRPVYW